MIIDFHSHLLPGIDDGSDSLATSRAMLAAAAGQGVRVQVLTPHFYAHRTNPQAFLQAREKALASLEESAAQHGIRLVPGAEVALFTNMGESESAELLCLQGTRVLLVEMPFRPWSGRDVAELEGLIDRGITPLLAHLERYTDFITDKFLWSDVLALPLLAQTNAGALIDRRRRRASLKLLRSGAVRLLGSDCHNTTTRPPNLAAGREIIRRKLGREYLAQIDSLGAQLLSPE